MPAPFRSRLDLVLRFASAAILPVLIASISFIPLALAQSGNSLPAAWSHWKYFRTVSLGETTVQRLISVAVPLEVYGRSTNNLADLRVIDNSGAEVPYLTESHYNYRQMADYPCRLQETSFVPGKYTQITCDAGASVGFHNGLYIHSPERNFMAWAEVAASDDAREWRIVIDRSPIYEFSGRRLAGVNTVQYGETNARYVRLRVFRSESAFAVSSLSLLHDVSIKFQTVPLPTNLAPDPAPFPTETVLRAELGGSGLPVDEVGIETSQPEFSRRVWIEASDDGEHWGSATASDIYRFREGKIQREALRISLNGIASPHVRIRILNENDSPLANLHITLYTIPLRIAFRQEPGRKYLLLYGQSEAHAPRYDISQTVNAEQIRAAAPAEGVGSEVTNAAWSDPRPWTDRNSVVLWVAAILSALLLALVTLRSLRHPPSQSTK